MIRKIVFYAMTAFALSVFPLSTFAAPAHKAVHKSDVAAIASEGATIQATVQAQKANSGGPNRQQVQIYFSNSGPATIDTFTMKLETHNYKFDTITTPNNGGEADTESFDVSTGIWKGSLEAGQRINLTIYGTVSDKPGEQYSITATALAASFESTPVPFLSESVLTANSTNDILYPAIDVEVNSSITNPEKIVEGDEVRVKVSVTNLGPDSGWDTELAGFFVYVFPPSNFEYSQYTSNNFTCQDEDELKDMLDEDYWRMADGRHGLLCKTTSGVSIQMPFLHGDSLTLDFNGTATSDFNEGNQFRTIMSPFRVGDPGFFVIGDLFMAGGNIWESTDNNISVLNYKAPVVPSTTTTTQPTVTTVPTSSTSTTPIEIEVKGASASRLPITGSATNAHIYTAAIFIVMGAGFIVASRRRKGIFG